MNTYRYGPHLRITLVTLLTLSMVANVAIHVTVGTGLQEDLPYLGYLWVITGTLLAAAPIALTAALIKAKELSQ